MRLIATIVFALGLVLVAITAGAPRYEPDGWNATVLERGPGADPKVASAEFFAAQSSARTSASRVQDVGRGLAALGGSVLLVLLTAGRRSQERERGWRSPSRASVIAAAAIGAWVSLAAAQVWWLGHTIHRGDHPPWADSAGIPLFGILVGSAIILPMIGLLLVLGLRRVTLPVAVADLELTPRFWVTSACALLVAVPLSVTLVRSVLSGAFLLVAATVLGLAAVCAWWPAAASRRR